MGTITFNGAAPFEPVFAQSASARPTPIAVELVVNFFVEGPQGDTVPIRILLEPAGVAQLAAQLGTAAAQTQRWIENPPRHWNG